MACAIIAYGSLLFDLGAELEAATVRRQLIAATPFRIEFARSSVTRSGGPTLVPVASPHGATVPATVLILGETVGLELAQDMLYRREARRPDATYSSGGSSWIKDAGPLDDAVTHQLYTALTQNIAQPTVEELAELAIASARQRNDRQDGISYLAEMLELGLETPLAHPYRDEILRRLNATSLADAWVRAHNGYLCASAEHDG